MATPLALRIVVKSDDAPLTATNQKLREFQTEMRKATIEAKGSKEDIQRFVESVRKMGQETPKAGNAFQQALGGIDKQIKPLMSQFKLLRRELGFVGLIATPFILATKSIIETNQQLIPLRTTLEQLGKASQGETARFLGFIQTLTLGTTTSVNDGISALSAYISKTKSTADAEKVLSAAMTLHLATGIKLPEATAAITDALQGETAALANLTLKTQEEISTLAKSGELPAKIQSSYTGAAQKAQSGMFNLGKRMAVTMWRGWIAATPLNSFATKKVDDGSTTIFGIKNLKKTIEALSNTKLSFNSLTDLRIQLGRVDQAIAETKTQLKNFWASAEQKQKISKALPALEAQAASIRNQIKSQQQLASTERNRLSTETGILASQAQLFFEQNRSLKTVNESNASLDKQKAIRKEILAAQLEQIHAEALLQARQILSAGKGITPEQTASIAIKEIQKRNQAIDESYQKEAHIAIKIKDSDTKLQSARLELQKFYLQNRLKMYSGQYSYEQIARIENQFVEKKVQFAIDAAKREAAELLSVGRLTATEKERIETELQLKLTTIRQDAENARSQETKTRLGRLTEAEQARVTMLAKQLAKDDRSSTAKAELEFYKKKSDEKLKVAKETDDALNKYFGEEVRVRAEKTTVPGDVTGQLQGMAKERISISDYYKPDLAKLKQEFASALTPDEKSTQESVTRYASDVQAVLNANPVKLPVSLEPTIDIARFAAKLVTEFQRKLTMGAIAAFVGKGAEQGGSES
jgi:hypothetical protein